MRLVWFVTAVLAASSCGKGDHKLCEQACRNYATLAFWSKWGPAIEAEPEDQRARLRRTKLGELEIILERGIDQCVTNCQTANNTGQYTCMAKAKTFPEVHACGASEDESD